MRQHILQALAAAVLLASAATPGLTHSDRGEKRPRTYDEVFIPFTKEDAVREPLFRHPPGNVRAEHMWPLLAGKVMLVDAGRKYSSVPGVVDHALMVVFMGPQGRNVWCVYGDTSDYYHRDQKWAPIRWKHGETYFPQLHPAIGEDKRPGLSPVYNGETGQIVFFTHRQPGWSTRSVGHLQERLPAAVWTLCPEFPSAEELGVGVNKNQTAVTYDKLLEQDPGRRVLRPDLITLDPTEPAK
ncbi:hypothetical protein [Ruegeria sp.]|uniref:hypothetical protein n=1 Tax=Ruegeria sp. TaxID=1879320 RepID=UPI003B001B75